MASKLLLLIEITGGELTEFFEVGAQNTNNIVDLVAKIQNKINVNTFDDDILLYSDVEVQKQNGILTWNFTPSLGPGLKIKEKVKYTVKDSII